MNFNLNDLEALGFALCADCETLTCRYCQPQHCAQCRKTLCDACMQDADTHRRGQCLSCAAGWSAQARTILAEAGGSDHYPATWDPDPKARHAGTARKR